MARIINTAEITRETVLSKNDREFIYNGLDCCVTLEVLQAIKPQLDPISQKTYDFSRALQGPILDMSMRGVRVDQRKRQEVLKLVKENIERVEAQLLCIVKEGVGVELSNWRSPAQLKSLFYDVMGLKPIKKRNSKGEFTATVDREAIEQLSNYFVAEPICNHMIVLRELEKKRQFLVTEIDADGRIRTNFNIAGTVTGRLASSFSDFGTGTNLMNVDRELRSVFVSDPGMKFGNVDLEQGDSRNVGAVCWNTFVESHGEAFAGSYLNACESSDLHTAVAKMVWPNKPWTGDAFEDRKIADILFYRQDSHRQMAKKLGHASNFFGKPPEISKRTKTDKPQVETFQQGYFAAFPVIGTYDKSDQRSDNWHNRIRLKLKSDPQITTLLGRRRYFFGRPYDDDTLRGAIAYEPQSLTADEIDTGLLRLWRGDRVQLLLQVHDSLLFQFSEEQEDEIIPWAIDLMKVMIPLKKGREFSVPLEAKTGWNWGEHNNENPDGLIKWKGTDQRTRQTKVEDRLSIQFL